MPYINIFSSDKSLLENSYFIACILSTFITLLLFLLAKQQLGYARKQLKEIKRTDLAKFYYDFKDDFFTPATSELIMLFNLKALTFTEEQYKENQDNIVYSFYFRINKEKLKTIIPNFVLIKENREIFTSYEIDDLLLGHFEDLGIFYSNEMMDEYLITEGFRYYIVAMGNNDQIQKYIFRLRKDGSEAYSKFEMLYKKYTAEEFKYNSEEKKL